MCIFLLYRRECGWLWWRIQRVCGWDVWRVTERFPTPPHRHPQRAGRVGCQQGLLHLQSHGQVTCPCQHVQVPWYGLLSSGYFCDDLIFAFFHNHLDTARNTIRRNYMRFVWIVSQLFYFCKFCENFMLKLVGSQLICYVAIRTCTIYQY